MSGRELSTTGRSSARSGAQPSDTVTGEEAFLWGTLGDRLGPLQLGIDLRPSHLSYSFGGTTSSRNLLMTADLLAAVSVRGWTAYGEIGREPQSVGSKIDSYEYWVGHQSDN